MQNAIIILLCTFCATLSAQTVSKDALGRDTLYTYPDGTTIHIVYDASGNRIRVETTGAIDLPVELTLFNAIKFENAVQTFWETASETNTSHFVVEWSLDGISFLEIGRVAASGNSTSTLNYQLVHQYPGQGYNYYRLKIVDNDGSYTYSQVVVVLFDGEVAQTYLKAYPNPSTGLIRVDYTILSKSEELQVYDMLGKLVATYKLQENSYQFQLDLTPLASGAYTVRLLQKQIRLIKK